MALWYASRAAGLVLLLLLTATAALGAAHAGRAATGRWPRFAVHALHRNLALLAVALLAVHVAAAIVDPYAGIRWLDAVVPFGSTYHPFWLGLGAIALDLTAALVLTSLVRTRLPLRAWRVVHLAAYALWPVAVVHGLGIGGVDSGLTWVRAVDGLCAAAVLAALVVRLRARDADRDARRAMAVDR
jgi:methionine sulfoxide reductase heme-binding subunit